MYKVGSQQQFPHRVTIEKLVTIKNDFSGREKQWNPVFSRIYAKVTNRTGRESNADDQTNNFVSVFVRIRNRKGITPDMRVVHGDRKLNMLAVLPAPDGAYIDLQCEAWTDA